MCLAIPVKVVELRPEQMALVDDIAVGDYVVLHVGCALHRLDPEEAEETLRVMAEVGMLPEATRSAGMRRSSAKYAKMRIALSRCGLCSVDEEMWIGSAESNCPVSAEIQNR